MATPARVATRALRSSATCSTLRSATSRRLATAPRQAFQRQARRGFATSIPKASANNSTYILSGLAAALLSGAGYFTLTQPSAHAESPQTTPSQTSTPASKPIATRTPADYQAIYDAIAQRLIDEDDYDDGSYGPVVLRLGWHSSGTYDAATGTGGSNGATMRFNPESGHTANNGLRSGRDFLEPVKAQFPWISYADLWTLAAVCAVQEMGGPTVPWRPGRADRDESWCAPDGRLPDGSQGQNHLRRIFGRMGFSDQEIVALSGAHALGRCHKDRSGFEGPWTFSPTMLTNDYFKLLVDEHWHHRDWEGNMQWQDNSTNSIMMLPTDMVLVQDEGFKPFVEKYAESQDVFFEDFSNVVMKLFELGVPFSSSEDDRIEFKRLDE